MDSRILSRTSKKSDRLYRPLFHMCGAFNVLGFPHISLPGHSDGVLYRVYRDVGGSVLTLENLSRHTVL